MESDIKIITVMISLTACAFGLAVGLIGIVDGRAQNAENMVIIEQLCDVKPDSNWCKRLHK